MTWYMCLMSEKLRVLGLFVYLTVRSSWLLALIIVTAGMNPARCHHSTLVKMLWSVKSHIENDWSSSGKGNTCAQLSALHGSILAPVLIQLRCKEAVVLKCLLRVHRWACWAQGVKQINDHPTLLTCIYHWTIGPSRCLVHSALKKVHIYSI